jgi:hypothetical protein
MRLASLLLLAAPTLWLASAPVSVAAGEGFAWQDVSGEHLDLLYDGRPALRYIYHPLDESSPEAREATFKPYHHVWSPDGGTLLTKGPGGLYSHHRGLFFGFNRITYGDGQQADVWHCVEGASQTHARELERTADADHARHRVVIQWRGKDGKPFAEETRELAVRRGASGGGDGWLIDFTSHVEPVADGTVHLDGDPQHAGFHFRAAQEVAEKTAKQTYYLRTDGKGGLGETLNWDPAKPESEESRRSVNRPWDAMSFVIGGQRYTVLYLDYPQNPKPSRSSERDYGRFGSYFVADVTKQSPLDVKYRVWVQPGEMTVDQCEALHKEFVGSNQRQRSAAG